ncbi:DUF2179 domain-containing protein [bacterium]|nr:DUF2179 domain-containing protein [candidate division CSSED10-310 bacterium]
MSGPLFDWLILPMLICLARIIDVSIGTIRVIFVSKGFRYWAPLLGFFEVLIWILVIAQIMKNLNNPASYIGYALGFAIGNYVGIILESKLSIGMVMVRIITSRDASALIEYLKSRMLGVTSIQAEGAFEKVHVIFTIIKRSDYKSLTGKIREYNPQAFYSVEDIRFASEGVFPLGASSRNRLNYSVFRLFRKGK